MKVELKGEKFHLEKWKEYQKNWSHDHCEICYVGISNKDTEKEGYTTEDRYYWLCKKCFMKYKKELELKE